MKAPSHVVLVFGMLMLGIGCSPSGRPMRTPIGGSASEGNWPTFHGPRRDNISHEEGLLTKWPADGPALLWVADGIGEGYATVSVADGAVYTTGNLDNQTIVTSLNLDGSLRWQAPAGEAWTGSYEGSRSTPTIDDDRVYCASPHGQLVCLQAADGRPVWQVDILERFVAHNIKWGLAESPLVAGNLLICTPGGDRGRVAALDKMTGDTVWATTAGRGAAGYASAVAAEIHGTRVILTMTAKGLLGVDAADGRLLFEFPLNTSYDVHATTPICSDNHVYISAGYGTGSVMLRIERNGDNFRAVEKWRSPELDNHHGGVVLWDGFLYGASDQGNKGKWVCLDWDSGELLYAEKGVGKGSVMCVAGMLYTLSEKGRMGLVQATPKGHDVISRFSLPRDNGPAWAHPVVCGGALYLRYGNQVYCHAVSDRTTQRSPSSSSAAAAGLPSLPRLARSSFPVP